MYSLIFLVCTVFFFSRELPSVQEMSGALGMYGYPPRATFEEPQDANSDHQDAPGTTEYSVDNSQASNELSVTPHASSPPLPSFVDNSYFLETLPPHGIHCHCDRFYDVIIESHKLHFEYLLTIPCCSFVVKHE